MTTATDSATQSGATGEESQQQTAEQLAAQQAEEEKAREEQQKKDEDEARKRAAAPRTSMMEEIAARRNEDLARETATEKSAEELADEAAETERKRLEAEAAEAERKEQLRLQAGGEPEVTVISPADLARFKVRQTIDGQERDVPLSDVVRTAQVAGAADYRLAKATETLERAEALARDITAKAGGKAAGEGEDKGGEGEDKTEAQLNALVKDAFDKALDGDVEGATKILTEAMRDSRGRSATPDQEQIVAAAVERIKLEHAYTAFQTDYKDVVNDKRLGRMVDTEFAELVPKDDKGHFTPLSPEAFSQKLREAGDKVRTWRDSLGGGKKPTDPDPNAGKESLEQRKARKENLDQTTGASTRAPSSSTSSAEPTASERSSVIAQIAKGRGQQL
jgi:hypothetical protein